MTTKINCLADILAHIPRVRVIKKNDENYWKEFNIALHNYEDKEVTIISNHKYDYVRYQYSEIQFLTPVQYEGRYIGLGDKVDGNEVFGYHWYDGRWVVYSAIEGWGYGDCFVLNDNSINEFEPLHKLTGKIDLSTEELVEELKRRGVVTQGNIIKS